MLCWWSSTLVFYWCFLSTIFFVRGYLNVDIKLTQDDNVEQENYRILTPYLERGQLEEARKAAQVKLGDYFNFYSGFFQVDEVHDSNLFFWYFPSLTDHNNAPVMLWLPGGPGVSAAFGVCAANGPIVPLGPDKHDFRNTTWTWDHELLYIDCPVGTGYSYTRGGYAQNETIVGESLYKALLQFFQMFPWLQKRDFFVSGESYAGKCVTAIAYAIHNKNPLAQQKINLKGLAIGNGLVDPMHQRGYAAYLYQIGLIDFHAKVEIDKLDALILQDIQQKQWSKATTEFYSLFASIPIYSGFPNIYNYLISNDPFNSTMERVAKFVTSPLMRKLLQVGNLTFTPISSIVRDNLKEDIMQSVAPWFSTLLSHYRVLIYNGQLDTAIPYPLTVNFLKHLNFSSADIYKTAKRHKWFVGDKLAGYVKQAGNLTEVLVRNSGHIVAIDQPVWAQELISKFTHNYPLY